MTNGEDDRETGGPWVLPVVAVMSRFDELQARIADRLLPVVGPIVAASEPYTFDTEARYYEPTMGPGLVKRLLAAGSLRRAVELVGWKRSCMELERTIAGEADWGVERPINLDPGYLDFSRFVLASTKDAARRIYLARGIFAEITLRFESGAWQSFPWTYMDYREPVVIEALGRFRQHFRALFHQTNPQTRHGGESP